MAYPRAESPPNASSLSESPPPRSPRILVARPDRIGDVILSTPVIAALKAHYPHAHITFLVRDFVAPLVRNIPNVDAVFVYDPSGRHAGVTGFFRLMEELKAQRFQISIVLHSVFKLAAALYGVGVSNRIGPLSKIHSYLFYNRGSRQRRSLVEMHEADYNLQLLRKLGIRTGSHQIPSQIAVSDERKTWAKEWLESQGWIRDAANGRKRLVVVHPGMGGSALNWPENYYVDLIRALKKEGHDVLVTGGPEEGYLLERIKIQAAKTDDVVIVYGGSTSGPVDQLAALFQEADLVVAPSTGPLHVAVALGKPVVTFYPPIRVQSAIRWGPYVADPEDVGILVPEVYCGQDFKCRGPKCNYFPCMKMIGPREALDEVIRLLNRNPAPIAGEESHEPH